MDLRQLALSDNLYDALHELDELDSRAWILMELRGLPSREAAPLLGIDRTTVQRRADRARRHIKEMIA